MLLKGAQRVIFHPRIVANALRDGASETESSSKKSRRNNCTCTIFQKVIVGMRASPSYTHSSRSTGYTQQCIFQTVKRISTQNDEWLSIVCRMQKRKPTVAITTATKMKNDIFNCRLKEI